MIAALGLLRFYSLTRIKGKHNYIPDKNIIDMQDKLKSFLNSLTWGEALELYKFLRTKKWQTWIDTIIHNQKIE